MIPKHYSELFENDPEGIIVVDKQLDIVFKNNAVKEDNWLSTLDKKSLLEILQEKLINGKLPKQLTTFYKNTKNDNNRIRVKVCAFMIPNSDYQCIRFENMSGAIEDLLRLRESDIQKEAIITAIPDLIFLISDEGVFLDFSTSLEAPPIFLYDDLMNRSLYDVFELVLAERMIQKINKSIYAKKIERLEFQMRYQGVCETYEARIAPCGENKVLILCRNITESKHNIQKIKESLDEKEVLLKEVHHRVKNNMQIVYSLLRNQLKYVALPEAKDILEKTCLRISAMAIVHQKLYDEKLLNKINLVEYLESLSHELNESFHDTNVQFIKKLEPAIVNVDLALNIGLIVNELVSNSFKHAFEGKGPHIISISLKNIKEHLFLEVTDNGKGINKNIHDYQSFGLKLIDILSRKLKADVKMNTNFGTQFTFLIPIKK